MFVRANDVKEILKVSQAMGYKVIRTLNTELQEKGFKNNANFDMAVENFLIFIYREGRNIESSRDKL